MYHNKMVTVRLPQTTLDMVDAARGGTPRGTYIRGIIEHHLTPAEPVEMPAVPTGYDTPAIGDVPRAALAVVRHLHKYTQGDLIRHDKGVPIHTYTCECGATKEDR